MALSRNEVAARLAQVNIKDRSAPVVRPSPEGMRDALWINYYNVPPACTRLDHDLHRVLLVLRGFDKTDPDLPVHELRLHFCLAAFPFDRAFADKEGKAEDILALLTEFLEGIARDFKPWIPRHRRPESQRRG